MLASLHAAGVSAASVIGEIGSAAPGRIFVERSKGAERLRGLLAGNSISRSACDRVSACRHAR